MSVCVVVGNENLQLGAWITGRMLTIRAPLPKRGLDTRARLALFHGTALSAQQALGLEDNAPSQPDTRDPGPAMDHGRQRAFGFGSPNNG